MKRTYSDYMKPSILLLVGSEAYYNDPDNSTSNLYSILNVREKKREYDYIYLDPANGKYNLNVPPAMYSKNANTNYLDL